MKFRSFVSLVVAIATTSAALANNPPALAPSTPWTLDYADDSCALRRFFGEGNDKVYLELRRFEPGVDLQVIVASKRMKANNPATFKFRLGHADSEWNDIRWAPTVTTSGGLSGIIFGIGFAKFPELEELKDPVKKRAYVYSIDWRSREAELAAQTDTLVVRGAFPREIALDLGPMVKPIAALDTCMDELVTHWNIDVEAHKSLSRLATPTNWREGTRMIDYPPAMLRASMPGIVNIRLDIDTQGAVTGCHIQMPLSDPTFAKSSCADIQHALEFAPALDKDGRPIPSYYVTNVRFVLAG